ncbi:MAG: DUF5658 family protein [bacterium]
MPEFPHPDRRVQKDRRTKQTSPLSSHSLSGSRKDIRRKEDRNVHFYVDRYSIRSILVVQVALILSIADAVFTVKLVGMGAKEINPVMDFFLRFGPVPFLLVKYVLTGSCLIWFLVHKNYFLFGSRISVKHILILVPILYTILISYELVLIL